MIAIRVALVLLSMGCLVPAAAQFQAQRFGALEFHTCELGGEGTPLLSARCARFEVPEDRALTGGRRLGLAVAWLPARSQKPRTDALIFFAGGPGQSALESYPLIAAALDGLRRERHVILVDQRGTGGSNRLHCPLPDWTDPAAATPAALRKLAASCREALSARADLRRYGTVDYLLDVEQLRVALGIAQFNVVGGSYGTRVALEYLRRYPQSVRSVVLDAVVPPELALLQDHARNLDEALAQQFAACAARRSCAQRFGASRTVLDRLLRELKEAPAVLAFADPRTHRPLRELLTADLLAAVVRLYAYAPESAALLPLLLDEAVQGRPQALAAQAQMLIESLDRQLAHGMELSVICTEDAPFLQPRPDDATTVLGDQLQELVRAQCAVWPQGELPEKFRTPVRSVHPVLLLSGEFDPVTPPRYAGAVAAHLPNSRHLIAKGQGHIVMTRGCMPRLIRRFVEDLQPAQLETGCLDVLGPAPTFETYQGPAP